MLPKQTDTAPLQRRLPNAVPSETERAGSGVWQYLLRTMSQTVGCIQMQKSAHLVETGGQDRHLPSPLGGWPAVGLDVHTLHKPLGAWVRVSVARSPTPRPESSCGPICPARKCKQAGWAEAKMPISASTAHQPFTCNPRGV